MAIVWLSKGFVTNKDVYSADLSSVWPENARSKVKLYHNNKWVQ